MLLVCDADHGARLLGAPGASIRRDGACCRCQCTRVCAMLEGCSRGVAGPCVCCFLFFECVMLAHYNDSVHSLQLLLCATPAFVLLLISLVIYAQCYTVDVRRKSHVTLPMFLRGSYICHAGCRAFLRSAKHVSANVLQKNAGSLASI